MGGRARRSTGAPGKSESDGAGIGPSSRVAGQRWRPPVMHLAARTRGLRILLAGVPRRLLNNSRVEKHYAKGGRDGTSRGRAYLRLGFHPQEDRRGVVHNTRFPFRLSGEAAGVRVRPCAAKSGKEPRRRISRLFNLTFARRMGRPNEQSALPVRASPPLRSLFADSDGCKWKLTDCHLPRNEESPAALSESSRYGEAEGVCSITAGVLAPEMFAFFTCLQAQTERTLDERPCHPGSANSRYRLHA